jgi:hypothetical protein
MQQANSSSVNLREKFLEQVMADDGAMESKPLLSSIHIDSSAHGSTRRLDSFSSIDSTEHVSLISNQILPASNGVRRFPTTPQMHRMH